MNVLLTTLNSKFIHSNLALRYLYESCDKNKEMVEVKEFTINNSEDYILTELVAGNYHLVCFSCYIWNTPKILHITSNLKKANKDVIIALGGPEVSYDAEDVLAKNAHIDMVLVGEGEETFSSLVGMLNENEKIDVAKIVTDLNMDGVCYRDNGEIILRPQSKLVDMAKVPFPYTEGYDEDKVVYYEGTRGCPYNCSYCMSSIDKTVRGLPLDRLKEEMLYFLNKNVRQVKFLDRTFNWHKERSNEIFDFLIKNDNGKTNFHFEICADNLTDETMEIIKNAREGLFQFEIGIQSTYQKTLDAVNRSSNNVKLMENVLKVISFGNIHTHVDLIAGLPYETFEIFGHSFDDVYNLKADQLQLGFLKLLKGTKVRAEEEEHQYEYDSLCPYQVISNKYISALELITLKKIENMVDIYYNKGGYGKSLDKLVSMYDRPFEFYKEFAEFYYAKGFQHRSHKKEEQYRILNKFAKEVLGDDSIEEVIFADLEEAMNFDAVKKFVRKGWEING